MAVPNKRRFENFLEAVKWNPSGEAFTSFRKIHFGDGFEPTEDYVRALLIEYLSESKRFLINASAHPVYKWLHNQPSTKRAFKTRRYGEVADISDTDDQHWVEEETRRVMNAYKEHTDRTWYHKLNFILTYNNPLSVTEVVATSLYHYYHTDRWRQLFNASRDARKTLTSAINLIKALQELDTKLEVLERFHATRRLRFLKFVRESELRLVEKNLLASLEDNYFRFPGKRTDKTAKERVLVFDLATKFKWYFGHEKPSAIYHLMATEGIKHSLDQRTIEKLISQWRITHKRALELAKGNDLAADWYVTRILYPKVNT